MNSFFQCGPPFDSRVEIFLSSWRSRPPEHGSTHHGETGTIQIFHVLTFDLKNWIVTFLGNLPYWFFEVSYWSLVGTEWIVKASPWCVDPCSSGVDLQELKKFFANGPKGGPQ